MDLSSFAEWEELELDFNESLESAFPVSSSNCQEVAQLELYQIVENKHIIVLVVICSD